ncbi:MAG: 50S ribosomal protein L11 [Candidatus Lokiarchaeota archaeon]|nr:50S ribosomal protein L11 [Candidatus Lokiarchaeota archaeon]
MGDKVTVDALVEGGKASAGPPIGPALGPTGANLYQVVQNINELTKDFMGLKIPVKITVDKETKEFEVEIGSPPVSALLLRELSGVEKGSSEANKTFVGDLELSKIVSIAKAKRPKLLVKSLKAAVKTVLGTCVSMGVKVEGKHPKELFSEIDEGKYDDIIIES